MDWSSRQLRPTYMDQSSQSQTQMPRPRSTMSPSLSQTSQPSRSQLKWHNTIAEDFAAAPLGAPASVSRKRSSSIAFTDTSEAAYSFAGDENFGKLVPSPLPSPTKRSRKTSTNGSFFTTPVRAEPQKGLTSGTAASVSSGIQTPPPSTVSKPRKKGKQIKKVAVVAKESMSAKKDISASKGSLNTPANPFPEGFSLPPQMNMQTGLDGSHLHVIPTSSHGVSADFSPSRFWDSAMAEATASNGMVIGTGHGDINTQMQSMIAQPGEGFDWSLLNTNPGDSPMFNLFGTPSKFNGTPQNAEIKPDHLNVQATTDALNLSFLHDFSQGGVQASPLGVNPNLIFSSRNIARNIFDDELGHLQPYRQQFLEQQQEELENMQKMQSVPLQQSAKSSSKPVLKRTQSESVLIRPSISKSKSQSNMNGTLLKKSPSKSVVGNDENITPSPPTSTTMGYSSPTRSSAVKRSQSRLRTLVNFSVSPGGRAKAEAIHIPEPESESEDIDPEESWEGCESDSSTDIDEPQLSSLLSSSRNRRSRNLGSHFRGSSALRGPASQVSLSRPRLARFNTAPLTSHHSNPRPPTYDPSMLETPTLARTLNTLPESSPTLPSPLKSRSLKVLKSKTPLKKGRRSSISTTYSSTSMNAPSLSSMHEGSDQSEAETVVDEPEYEYAGDAIQALRRAVARRQSAAHARSSPLVVRKPQGNNKIKHRVYNGSHSVQPKGYRQLAPPDTRFAVTDTTFFTTPYSGPQDFFAGSFNISPTTITDPDAVTPRKVISKVTGFKNGLEELIRCRCGVTENGRAAMIQCDTCSNWLHIRCENLTKKKVPNFFVCSFCHSEHSGRKSRTPQSGPISGNSTIKATKRRDDILASSPLARKVATK